MTLVDTMVRGFQASVTLDNINLSNAAEGSDTRTGKGMIELVNLQKASYEKIYRSQIWVATVVNKLSRGIARLPLKTYEDGDQPAERTRHRRGPLPDLLRRPFPGGSPFAWKASVVGNVGIYGNCVAVKVYEQGKGRAPTWLIPSSFGQWVLIPGEGPLGKGRPIDWYVFTSNVGQRMPFRPEEVVHFKWWGPGLDIVGAPPMEPLRRTLIIEDAAQRTQIASYEHGNRPAGAWSTEAKLNEDQIKTIRQQLDDIYGGVDNAFKMAVLTGGVKWSPMSHNLVDSEIVATRKLTREEVAAAYDMPPPAIEILDRATFSNITEQMISLYRDTFAPWLTMIEETLEVQLIEPEPEFEGKYVEFDLNEALKGDPEKRFRAYQSAQWWMTPNEVRQRENLPPIDDDRANSINVPLNLEPVGPLQEARCPTCDKLLAKDVVEAELWCDRCKVPVQVREGAIIPAGTPA